MKAKGQMSESMPLAIFLTLAGGLQDAYSYNCRGKVFANAQTGNIVLLGQNLAEGNWGVALHYLIPLLAFISGVYVAVRIQSVQRKRKNPLETDCAGHSDHIAVFGRLVSAEYECTGQCDDVIQLCDAGKCLAGNSTGFRVQRPCVSEICEVRQKCSVNIR